MHSAYNPDLAAHTTHRTKPVPNPHQSTLRRMCQLYSTGLPPQCLVLLQFRKRLYTRSRSRTAQQVMSPGCRHQICRPAKPYFRDCHNRFCSNRLLRNLQLKRW